ncbi:MAG: Tol-pal system protein YbgF, partial [Verrucomicrobiales bacterium]|nr:Tol-pal system protein YbgF [Verrucomicrobiales bacterium]
RFLQNTNEEALGEAIHALSKSLALETNSPLSARAWGRMGDYHKQWALIVKTNEAEFDLAKQAYENSIQSQGADISCRNQAQIGLGEVFEHRGNPIAALVQYRKVIDDEESDLFWVKEAGLAAVRILESREEWDSVQKVYERLKRILPALGPVFEKKILIAQSHLDAAKK